LHLIFELCLVFLLFFQLGGREIHLLLEVILIDGELVVNAKIWWLFRLASVVTV